MLFSSKDKLNPETFSDKEEFSSRHQQALGNNELSFRESNPQTSVKSILEDHRDHTLAEVRSEIMKQACKVVSLLTLALVNFNDKLILSGWNWMKQIVGMKNLKESMFDLKKNWLWERKHFEILVSETSMKRTN